PKPCLVMEWCAFGCLTDVLKNPDETICWPEFFSFGSQMLQSVYALHIREPPIVHRDLKSLNYLVDRYYCIKLCDFGLARMTQQKGTTIRESLAEELRNTRGTYEYLAPEIYSGEIYTAKSDIYSLAIILWEIAYRCLKREWMKPYGDLKHMIPAALYISVAKRQSRPKFPDNCPPIIRDLITGAWHQDPAQRPSIDILMSAFLATQQVYESNTTEWDALIAPPEESADVAIELPNDDDDQVRRSTSGQNPPEESDISVPESSDSSDSSGSFQQEALLSQYKALMEKFPNDLPLFERMLRRLAEKLENRSASD
ncbi:MAG: protein kinase, partial [archaeon]|nr:protein kinase [archaeon]